MGYPVWPDFGKFCQFGAILKVLGFFSISQNVDPTEANMFYHWASFYCCSWPNTLKSFSPFGHTGAT